MQAARERSKEVERSRREVSDLLSRYTQFVCLAAVTRGGKGSLGVRCRRVRSRICSSLCTAGWKGLRKAWRGWSGLGGRRWPGGSESIRGTRHGNTLHVDTVTDAYLTDVVPPACAPAKLEHSG